MEHLGLLLQYTEAETWQRSIREVLSEAPLTVDASYRVYTPGSALALALGPRRCAAIGEESPELLGLIYAMHAAAIAWEVHNESRRGESVSMPLIRGRMDGWYGQIFQRHVDTPAVCRAFVETAMCLVPFTIVPEVDPRRHLEREFRVLERQMASVVMPKVSGGLEAARLLAGTYVGKPEKATSEKLVEGLALISREKVGLKTLALCTSRAMAQCDAVQDAVAMLRVLVCSEQWASKGHCCAVGYELWHCVENDVTWLRLDRLQQESTSVHEVANALDAVLQYGERIDAIAENIVSRMRTRHGGEAIRAIRSVQCTGVEETRARLWRLLALVPTERLCDVQFAGSARVCAHSVMASSHWRTHICCPWNETDARAAVRRATLGELRTRLAADLSYAISRASASVLYDEELLRSITRRPVCQVALTPVPGHMDNVLKSPGAVRCYLDHLGDDRLGDWQCLYTADYGFQHPCPEVVLFLAYSPEVTEWLRGAAFGWQEAILDRPALLLAFGRTPIPAEYQLSWSMFLDEHIGALARRDARVAEFVRSMPLLATKDVRKHMASAIAANPECLCHIRTSSGPSRVMRYVRMCPQRLALEPATRTAVARKWYMRRALRETVLEEGTE
jgi:hypothetical protein